MRETIGYRFFFTFFTACFVCISITLPTSRGQQLEYDFKLPGSREVQLSYINNTNSITDENNPAEASKEAHEPVSLTAPALINENAAPQDNPYGYSEINKNIPVYMKYRKSAGTDAGAKTNASAGSETDAGAGLETDAGTGSDTDTDAGSDTGAGAGAEVNTYAGEAGLDPNRINVGGASLGDDANGGASAETEQIRGNGGAGIVILDAGHGGADPGSCEAGAYEKDIALDVTLLTAEILAEAGVEFILTRDADEFVSVEQRIEYTKSNIDAAAFIISIHCDWYKQKPINGTSTLYGAGDGKSIKLAKKIQSFLAANLGTEDRGVHPHKDIMLLRESQIPAVMVELAFISNKRDLSLLNTEKFRAQAAQNLADGIMAAIEDAQ